MAKPSDIFKSMDDVEAFCVALRPICSEDEYRSLKIFFGLGEQEGVSEDVPGIGPIDRSIAALIKNVNAAGYPTLACCSGLDSEHPNREYPLPGYLSFLLTDATTSMLKEKGIWQTFACCISECYLKPSIQIEITGDDDKDKRQKWAELAQMLDV